MKRSMLSVTGLLVVSLLAVGLTTVGMRVRPIGGTISAAPVDFGQALQDRLVSQSIPVKEVIVRGESPLRIAVVLWQLEGMTPLGFRWYRFLTEREVALAYLTLGRRVEDFTLSMADEHGQSVEHSTRWFSPQEFSQIVTPMPASGLDEQAVARRVQAVLAEEHVWVLSVRVQPGPPELETGRHLFVQMEVDDGPDAAVSQWVNRVMSNQYLLDRELNEQSQASIAVLMLNLTSITGKPLATLIRDLEVHTETGWHDSSIEPWYPIPAPLIETATPNGLEATPTAISETTSTPAPYPLAVERDDWPDNPYPYPTLSIYP